MSPLARRFFRLLYHATVAVGRPVGGVRPRRAYDVLGRLAFDRPHFAWHTNRWGHALLLSPYYHIDRNILALGTYDLDLHLALERLLKPGMVAMDVGANLGEMALHMAKLVSPSGAVYAFEPVPELHARLRGHVERNGLEAVVYAEAVALSDRTGDAEIAFPDADKDNQGLGSIVNLTDKAGPGRATIPTVTLDDFVRDRKIDRLDLLKADVQGAELKLMAGGRATLERLQPDLLVEVSPDDLRHAGATGRDLLALIESMGYAVHELRRGRPGRRVRAAEVPEDYAATNVYCTRREETSRD